MTASVANPVHTKPEPAPLPTDQGAALIIEPLKLSPVELASETLGRDLLQVLLQEARALPDLWPKLSEQKQAGVIERFSQVVERAATHAVKLIAAGGNPTISGILESVAIKEGIKATFKVSQFDPMRHELIDSQGKVCLLVVANAADHLHAMDEVKPDPDQSKLPLDDSEGSFADDVAKAEAETGPGNLDPLYPEAIHFVIRERKPAVSAIQRELEVGYNRAARLLEAMQADRIVGPADEHGIRRVLVSATAAHSQPQKYGTYSYGDVQALLAKAAPEVTFNYLQSRLGIDQPLAQSLLIRLLDDGTIAIQSEAEVPTHNTYRVTISLDDLVLKME